MFQQRQRKQKVFHIALSLLCLVDLSVSSDCDCGISEPKYVNEIGESLNITCTCYYLRQLATIPDVFLKVPNGSQRPMHHVTGSTNFTSTIEITSCSQGGQYICMTEQCNQTTLRNSFYIRVEDTKRNPKLECIYNRHIYTMADLTCTWVGNCAENRYNWMLFYKKQSGAEYQKCMNTSHDSCVIRQDLFQFENYTVGVWRIDGWCLGWVKFIGQGGGIYLLRLVQTEYQRENKTFEYHLYTDESIWRLDVNVYNVTNVGPDKLNIILNVSDTIQTLICRVNYNSQWEQRLNQVNFSSFNFSNLTVIIPVEHLEPFTRYSLSVDCRSSWSPYWSAPTKNVLITTQPEAPDKIPSNILFADEILTTGKRQIYLYWNPLSKRNLRGDHTQYSVTFVNKTNRTSTEYFSSNTTTAIISHHFPPDDKIELLIGSRNEAGNGTLNKRISIPGHTPAPFQTVVVNGQDSSNISLFWAGQAEQEGPYIYYWCQGTSVSGHTPLCQTELVSKSNNDTTITIKTSFPGNRKWYFGAGVQRNENEASFGRIVFSKCTFTDTIQDKMPLPELSAFRLNSTIITIMLPEYCSFHNMPSIYQLATFTETVNCSKVQSYTNHSALPSLKTLNLKWTNDKTANICFRVVFNSGFAGESQFLSVESTDQLESPGSDQVESHGSKEIVVGVLVALGIVLVLASTILIRRYREKLKNRARIEDIIIFPSNPSQTTDRESVLDPVITDVDDYPVVTGMRDSSGYVDIETENQSVSDPRMIGTNGDEYGVDGGQSETLFSDTNTEEQSGMDSQNIFTRENTLFEDSALAGGRPEDEAPRAGTYSVIDRSVYSDEANHTDTFEIFTDDSLYANRMITQSGTDSDGSLMLSYASGNNIDARLHDISSSNSSNRSGSAINSYVQPVDISSDPRTLSNVNTDHSDNSYVLATNSGRVMNVSDMIRLNQVLHDGVLQAVSMDYVTASIVTNSTTDYSSDSAISASISRGSIGSYVAGAELTF